MPSSGRSESPEPRRSVRTARDIDAPDARLADDVRRLVASQGHERVYVEGDGEPAKEAPRLVVPDRVGDPSRFRFLLRR